LAAEAKEKQHLIEKEQFQLLQQQFQSQVQQI
jgi:hypothetical protein